MPHIKNALLRYRIIDKCLRNPYKQFPTKQDLREACEEALFGGQAGEHICDSTIEKDMFAMRIEHDAPIKYSKREKGYYYEDPEFSINDVPLNTDDLNAIKFAANTLMQFRDVELFKEFGSAIDKIVDRISISEGIKQSDLNQYVQFESAVSIGGGEFLPILLDGIQKNVAVYFEYENFNTNVVKSRKVTPLLLKEYRNRWYLISYDLVKESITTYALDRMKNVELSDESVQKPTSFNPESYFKYAIGISSGDSNHERIRFKANEVATKYLQTQPFHHSQKLISTIKQWSIFELEIYISEEFIRSVLSFGGEIEILEPESLRKTIMERCAQMANNYPKN